MPTVREAWTVSRGQSCSAPFCTAFVRIGFKTRSYRIATAMTGSPQITDITLANYRRCRRDGLAFMERRRLRRRKGQRPPPAAARPAQRSTCRRAPQECGAPPSPLQPRCAFNHRKIGKPHINAGLERARQEGNRAGKPVNLSQTHPRGGQCLLQCGAIGTHEAGTESLVTQFFGWSGCVGNCRRSAPHARLRKVPSC
jgi:hypothetical protein